MPIDSGIVEQFLGHPEPGSRTVWVRTGHPGGVRPFDGIAIPLDGRTYIVHGTTFLADGTAVQSRYEVDTSRPSPLIGSLWYIDGRWYVSFEPAALEALGVARAEASPFTWLPNVRLCSVESPPYPEGQAIRAIPGRSRRPWWRRLVDAVRGGPRGGKAQGQRARPVMLDEELDRPPTVR